MLRVPLLGRYARYKKDTSTFATWLQDAATTCGYQYTMEKEQTKQKKKSASVPSKINCPVKELLSQAKAVAKSSIQVILPASVFDAVQRAITARKDLNKHFELLGVNDRLNKSHVHFIQLLTESLNLVAPRKADTPTRPPKPKTLDGDNAEELGNRFQALHVEEIEDVEEPSTEEKTHNTAVAITVDVLEDEDDALGVKVQNILKVLTLFADLQDIREFVSASWKQYRDGKLDLTVCAMTTNAAMDLIKYECDILSDDLGIDSKDSYTGSMHHLNFMVGAEYGYSVQDVLKRPSPIDFLTCAEAAVSLREYITHMGRDLLIANKNVFPLIPCLRNVPSDLAALVPSYDYMMDRQYVLTQMLTDFSARLRSVSTGDQLNIARQMRDVPYDQLMESIGLSIANRAISTPALFAASMLLDIHYVLGAAEGRPLEELCKFAGLQKKAFHHTHLTSDARSGPQWGKDDSSTVHALHSNVDRIQQVEKWSRKRKVLENPVYRGTQLLNLEILVEDLGVRCANYHSSLIILGYLYNALKQKQLLPVDWPALELALTAHKDSLFFGSFPIEPKDSAMRLCLRLGLPLTAYLDLNPKYLKPPKPNQNMTKARTGGKAKGEVKSKLDPNCLHMTSTSQAIEKYLTGKDSMIRVVHEIVGIATKEAAATAKSTSGKGGSAGKSNHAAKALGPIKFLSTLQQWLVRNRTNARIDYIQLTRHCHTLMEEISTIIKPRMETDMAHLMSTRDRKIFEDARNNVPGAPTTHTVRYLDIVQKILVEDKERTEWRREIEFMEERGMAEERHLGRVSGIVGRFVEARVAEGARGG